MHALDKLSADPKELTTSSNMGWIGLKMKRKCTKFFQQGKSIILNVLFIDLFIRLIPLHQRLLALANHEEKRKVVLKQEKKLNWGVIGTGKMATRFITALVEAKSQKHRVVAIASSSDLKKAQELRGKFEILKDVCYCYGSYAELCADQNVEAVFIATPHTLHARDAIQALRMGKKVLVEKPISINQKETEMMISLAKETGLFLMEAMWTR